MVDKYFHGVIEQVYHKIGIENNNIVMVRYTNEFSVNNLEIVQHYENQSEVYFSCVELEYDSIVGGYEPFLKVICDMFRQYGTGSFVDFMKSCNVYTLHQEVLQSYFDTGICQRKENVLIDEVEYEQERMTEAIAAMLCKLSMMHPVMLVINRFQLVGKSTLELMLEIIKNSTENMGIVIGVNETPMQQAEGGIESWGNLLEMLEDASHVYHLGNTFVRRSETRAKESRLREWGGILIKISNMVELLDFQQAKYYLGYYDKQLRFEGMMIEDKNKQMLYLLYVKTSVLCGDIPRALELLEEIEHRGNDEINRALRYYKEYYKATCYMYQGKLFKGKTHIKNAQTIAQELKDEKLYFEAELLGVQNQMSGWYNIFFCAQNVPISEEFVQKLEEKGYKNNLAHIYIYAFDNQPEMVAKAYHREADLYYFNKGVALAEEIGNEHLVYNAYQKNIMLASTNGMYEIAILYSVRSYQFLKNKKTVEAARVYNGLGYNLCALGYYEKAEVYYQHALEMFYECQCPEDIAEVQYNQALNYILSGDYGKAEHELLLTMKAIERLHLNSLRVCNLSKLYGLLAVVCILQGDHFSCERYLLNSSQFLTYILEKDKQQNRIGIIHDYAKCDDDMFLYSFSKALLAYMNENLEETSKYLDEAEMYLQNSKGNQFYIYRIFKKKRMEFFEEVGETRRYQQEVDDLEAYEKEMRCDSDALSLEHLNEMEDDNFIECPVIAQSSIDELMKQKGMAKDLQITRTQMEFISSWQKLIDANDLDISAMVGRAMVTFLNHFNNDCALYIRFHAGVSEVLYNNTSCRADETFLAFLQQYMKEYPQGFAVSKISGNYAEHQQLISFFGLDEVCSIVVVPYFKEHRLKSILITYIRMQDNWHSSIDRYMLNDDDLNIYKLLFRDLGYSINRMEAYGKIFEMNHKLAQAAVTDVLTGIYNRAGMYQEVANKVDSWKKNGCSGSMGLMFIDLDNFKHYNDTFGHDAGDIILKSMADIFTEVTGNQGFVSRYGGDEFIIIFDTNKKDVLENVAKGIYGQIERSNGFAQKLSEALGHEIIVDDSQKITCSIGIAASTDVQSEDEIEKLIQKADDLLYQAKTNQKGTYVFLEK